MSRTSSSVGVIYFAITLLASFVAVAHASLFRGGSAHLKTIGPISRYASVTIDVTQRYRWRRSYELHDTYCDNSTINSREIVAAVGYFTCRNGCTGSLSVGGFCTDYSVSRDWTVSERIHRISVPFARVLEASFASTHAWINSLVLGGGGNLEIRAKLNLNVILAKRTDNVSPESRMAPILNLLHGCSHTLSIPVVDFDGDDVRCRWAESGRGECGGVCQAFPGAVLNEHDCTLFLNATGNVGLYVVAIQTEDFYAATDIVPLSSVPLQFIVNVYESPYGNASCYEKPRFIRPPTRRSGACVGIPLNSTFHEAILAESVGSGISIQEIAIQSPPGVMQSDLAMGPYVNSWYVNITWAPLPSQVGNDIFCFTATDSSGISSDQNCVVFAVGAYPPELKNGSLFPTGEVPNDNSIWKFEFDRSFVRPRRSAHIRFFNETDAEIVSVDTSISTDVIFPRSSRSLTLTFTTAFLFSEKSTYYITIDRGIVSGTDACGPESVGVSDPFFWRFSIVDVTPPVLTFMPHEMYSLGSINISWTYNEPATSKCLIQSSQSTFGIACNNSLSLFNLTEGDYTLFVQASDSSGNAKQYQTSWYVDLTAPNAMITSRPPLITNKQSATFAITCSDRSPCQLWCADHEPGLTELSFVNCSSTYTATSVSDGVRVFTVYGVDVVGNVGNRVTYTWTVDTVPPTISQLSHVAVVCGNPYNPSTIGIPTSTDNIDPSPSVTHSDTPVTGCRTIRTWTATDHAGNAVNSTQIISFTNVINPIVGGAEQLFVPCGETDRLTTPDYVMQALNITSPCNREITVDHTDSTVITECSITVTRQWRIMDDCNSVAYFTQTIHVLRQSFPDFPANGEMHVRLNPRLGWPTYPRSQGYNLYLWRYGSSQPMTPISFVQVWQQRYIVADSLPPNTRFLWRIGYIVPFGNGTREIPSDVWGFQTESYADLSVTSVQVPETALSGSLFSVTWVVENIGNVSTSQSTFSYYDAIYLSRSSDFDDAYRTTRSRQHRLVDPQDGYTFTDDVQLQPSNIGRFYVFIVVDLYGNVEDISRTNNRRLATHSVNVRLTPPPNLQVKSTTYVGSILAGKQTTLSIAVENSGSGITQAAQWYDRIFLSLDDQRSNDDQVLTTIVHNGALASGQQYASLVEVTIPNAIYGDYYVIVSTDIYDDVYEHNDNDDNDFPLEIEILISESPDLVVSGITLPDVMTTGDTIRILAVIENEGSGAPFEYFWRDRLSIIATTNGSGIFSKTTRYSPGITPFTPGNSYVFSVEYTVPPTVQSGEYNVTVFADVGNEVFEFRSDDNNQRTVMVTINQVLPDLTLGPSSAVVVENSTGNYLTVNISILNNGPGSPQIPSWENTITLSSSQTTAQLTSFLIPNIFSENRLVSSLTTRVSSSIVGSFDVYVSVDSRNQVYETDETNNYVLVERVILQERVPDLVVKLVSTTDSATSGSVILVDWKVENIGNLAARHQISWYDDITLTAESGFKTLLSSVLISLSDDLQPQQSYERQLNVTLPSNLAGLYRLGVTTALYRTTIGDELNQANNYMETPISISTPRSPDLRPINCEYEIRSQFNTRLLVVVCTVENLGNSMDEAMNWTNRISVVTADGTPVLTKYVSGVRKLSFGDTYSSSTTFVLTPDISGYFQVSIEVDSSHNVTEIGGEVNNELRISHSPVFISPSPSPRLSVVIEPITQKIFQSGETLSVNCFVTNTGEADLSLSTWTDSLFLFSSPDATKQQVVKYSGFLISSIINSYRLKIGASYRETFLGVLPYSVNGPMYIYVVTDVNDRLPMSAAFSNTATYLNTTIDIQPGPLPDLEISLTGNSSTVRVQSGQVYELEFVVTNIGNASASGIWYDTVYLSQEKLIDPFDIALKTAVRPRALDKGESYTQKLPFAIPFDLPDFTYYFIVAANVRREVFESSFDNNNQYQLTEIVVLPAVDLVVKNVSISATNASYLDNVDFQWIIENNGSRDTFGYKCDSVYLSTDDVWHISDMTVVEPRCGNFRLEQKGSASDFSTYQSTGIIPPVAKGSYKSIVRTRSNVRDYNLENNIGVSVQDISVYPPTISLGENKTYDFITNDRMTFELTNIPVGIGLIVRLNTLYEFAYHGLFIKRNSPPANNDYDVAYKRTGTTQQTVYLPYTKSGEFYLLVESASALYQQSYQVSVSVKEAKFEVTSVYPSVLAKSDAVTVRVDGTLFGRQLRAFLTNDSDIETAATMVYRFTSEEAYATFNSRRLTTGTYGLLLRDVGRNKSYELKRAVDVSGLAIAGKLVVDISTPRALRPGESGIVDVRVDNSGYSDVSMPLLLINAGHSSVRLFSTQSDVGVLPSNNIFFFPLTKNRPPSMILPRSSSVFSFRAIPDVGFVGVAPISLYTVNEELVRTIISRYGEEQKQTNVASDIWSIVWRNVEQCFGRNPTALLRTINGHFSQHYTATNPLDNLIAHVVGVASGTLPYLVLSESVDIEDQTYLSSLALGVIRTYNHQLTIRRTVGPFGKGWTSPLLEMKVDVSTGSIVLTNQRREFTFRSDGDNRLFSSPSLPNNRIRINSTDAVYTSNTISFVFDVNTGLLKKIADETIGEFISVTHGDNNMPSRLTHHSSGSTINIVYGSHGFISTVELSRSRDVLSTVYYSYNDEGYLIRVASDSVKQYQYTKDGDLSFILQGRQGMAITYDTMYLMTRTVDYVDDMVIKELQIDRYCDGSIKSTVLPQNLSSFFVFGPGGELLEQSADDSLPVSYHRDNAKDELYVAVGDDLKQIHSFDQSSMTYSITNANDEKLALKFKPDGKVASIGDALQSPYYSASYSGDLLASVTYSDGTEQKFTYNERRQRTSATLRDGSQINYSYDDNQYLSVVQTSSGPYVYSYNFVGLLTAVSSPDGGRTTLEYDGQGLPTSVAYPDGTTLRYTYNRCGLRSSLTSSTGYNATYVYDSLCRLLKLMDGSGSILATYEYGENAQLVKKQLANGMYTEYAYESGSFRLVRLRNFFPNGTLMSYYSYRYNEWGHRVETETHEGIWKYRYDALGQLIEWRSPFSEVYENIEYSSNLNRKFKQTANDKSFYTTNSLYQYTAYGNNEDFTYDLNGNLLSKSKRNGSRMHVERFTYDQLGHCTSISADQVTCRYEYSVFGAVSSKNCSSGYHAKYLVDPFGAYGTSVLAEQTASGEKNMYYGEEHGLIATMESVDPQAAVFYIFDGDGSTIHTASQSAEIISSYIYDPFGRLLPISADDVNLFRFLGQYGILIVTETANIVLIRNRLYDSEHGRFISPDPTGVFGSPTNPYTYANNNPLTFKDTNGLIPIVIPIGIAGRALAVRILRGAVKGGAQAALNYLCKTYATALASGKKPQFDMRELVKATTLGALQGAIASLNPFKSSVGKFASGFAESLITNVFVAPAYDSLTSNKPFKIDFKPEYLLEALESGLLNTLPEEDFGPIEKCLHAAHKALIKDLEIPTDDPVGTLDMPWVGSIDPNEITGPRGYGDKNYISAAQSLLYKIEFENNENATAPAQKVIIKCPIDPNLNIGTFRVGVVTFDTFEKDFGLVSNFGFDRVDATEKTETFVDIQVYTNAATEEAVWELHSVDPENGLPPSNPLIGFLPPNNGTNGQGYVTFSIDLKSSVQTETKITESATIVFDENPHIDTSTIFNTIDKTAGTVAINVSTLFDGIMLNLVTSDVGSGVKFVDLYLVHDGSAQLLQSDVNQSVVFVDLTENVLHTIVGVVTDNVGNSGWLDIAESVGVYVPADCPANCSGRGRCGIGGVCICDSGYAGYNCSLNATLSCEPPILDVAHADFVQNDSLVVYISARSSQSEPAISLSVRIVCRPNDTVISRGSRQSDGSVYLDEAEFGSVQFTTPEWFYGLLACTIQATVVDECGTNVRAVLMAAHVVAPADRTTARTEFPSPATTETVGTYRPIVTHSVTLASPMTGSMSQSPTVSGRPDGTATTATVDRTTSKTDYESPTTAGRSTVSVVGTERPVMTHSVTPVSAMTGSSSQSPIVSGRSDGTVTTATAASLSQAGTTMQRVSAISDVTVTKVSVTQVSGASEGTTTTAIWGPWSEWTACSRTCDTGVQMRTRQCLLSSPADCGRGSSDRSFCQLSTCSG